MFEVLQQLADDLFHVPIFLITGFDLSTVWSAPTYTRVAGYGSILYKIGQAERNDMTGSDERVIDGLCACVGAVLFLAACGQTNDAQTGAETPPAAKCTECSSVSSDGWRQVRDEVLRHEQRERKGR